MGCGGISASFSALSLSDFREGAEFFIPNADAVRQSEPCMDSREGV